jgi:hypothetical protein
MIDFFHVTRVTRETIAPRESEPRAMVCLHTHTHTHTHTEREKEDGDLTRLFKLCIGIYIRKFYDVTTVSLTVSSRRGGARVNTARISLSVPAASADAFMHEPLVSNQHRPFPFL